jgi:prophage regulatory protein
MPVVYFYPSRPQRVLQDSINRKGMNMDNVMTEMLVRKREVLKMTGWSNSTLYNRIASREFKPGVKTGVRMVAWPLSEVQAYISQRIAERNAEGSAA